MVKYGYARVSTQSQELESQLQTLEKEGCDKIYSEHFTGTKKDRPQFNKLLAQLEEGDTLVVTKLDRLARNTRDAIDTVKDLFERGVKVHVLNMGLVEDTPTGNLIFTVMMAFAQFERDMIVERTQEGKALARQKEGFKEGRPNKYTKKQLDHAISLLESNSYNQVADLTGISKSTLIREVKKRKVNVEYWNISFGEIKGKKDIEASEGTEKSPNDDINFNFSTQKVELSGAKTESNAFRNYELQKHHFDRFCNDCGESVAVDAEECGYCGGQSFDVMDLNDL